MKKKWLSLFCLVGIFFSLCSVSAKESKQDRNRVSSVSIQATLNPDKTITVLEEGILWPKEKEERIWLTVSNQSISQKLTIEDLVVKGIPATIEENGNLPEILLQEEKGKLQSRYAYSMSYTLRYYEDDNELEDPLDMLLIPYFQDFNIEGMSLKLEAPDNFQRENWNFICQYKEGCSNFNGRWNDNIFEGKTTQTFEGYSYPKLSIHYAQGSFQNVDSYPYPIVYHEVSTDLEIVSNFDIIVQRHIKATLNEEMNYSIELNYSSYQSDYEIVDLTISDPDFKLTSYGGDRVKLDNWKQDIDLTLSYKIHYTSYPDVLRIDLVDPFNQGLVEKMNVSIQFPMILDINEEYYDQQYRDLAKQQVEWSEDRLHYTIRNTEKIEDTDSLKLRINLDKALEQTSGFKAYLSFTMLALVTLIVGLILRTKLRKEKKLNREIPKRLNPVQARLYKGLPIRSQDFRFLVLHWICEGNILVNGLNGHLDLTRNRELGHCPMWEKDLLNTLFNGMTTLSLRSVSQRFTDSCHDVAMQARKENKPQPVYFTIKCVLLAMIYVTVLICPIIFKMQDSTNFLGVNLLWAFALALALLICLGLAHVVSIKKKDKKTFVLLGIVILIFASIMLETSIPQWTGEMLVLIILSLINISIVSRIQPWDDLCLTKYYNLINWIAYLNLASDAQINDVLTTDPDYAMKAYPYTAALEEKRLWESRFLTQVLPTLSTVFDESGKEAQYWVLDELAERLKEIC